MNAECGYSDEQHLVLCLNADFQLSASDQLRLLAFAQDPVRLTVGSNRAAAAARAVLGERPSLPQNIEAALASSACQGDCERRITVELQ